MLRRTQSIEKDHFEVKVIGKQLEKMSNFVSVCGVLGCDSSLILINIEYLSDLVNRSQQCKTYSEFVAIKNEYRMYEKLDKCKNKKQVLSLLKKETKGYSALIAEKISSIEPKTENQKLAVELGDTLLEFGKVINLFVNNERKKMRDNEVA